MFRQFAARLWVRSLVFFPWHGVGRGVTLVLPLPSLCWRMHSSVNGLTKWTTDRALVCGCVVCGHALSTGSVRLVVYVHVWAGRPSCWLGVRFWCFWLGCCASWFSCARGGQRGGGWGAAGVPLWGRGCPVFLPPVCCSLAFGGFNLFSPVAVCAGRPLWAWGESVLSSSSGLVTNALDGWRAVERVVASSGAWLFPPLGLCPVVQRGRLTVSLWH